MLKDTRYCGTTPAHCLSENGCQNGCTVAGPSQTKSVVSPTPSTSPRVDGRCGSAFGGSACELNGPYGGCCSSYGHVSSRADMADTHTLRDVC